MGEREKDGNCVNVCVCMSTKDSEKVRNRLRERERERVPECVQVGYKLQRMISKPISRGYL